VGRRSTAARLEPVLDGPLLLSLPRHARLLGAPAGHHGIHSSRAVGVGQPDSRLQSGAHRVRGAGGRGDVPARTRADRPDRRRAPGRRRLRVFAVSRAADLSPAGADGRLDSGRYVGAASVLRDRFSTGARRLHGVLRAAGVFERLLPLLHVHPGRHRQRARTVACARGTLAPGDRARPVGAGDPCGTCSNRRRLPARQA
jgi:hypothetical protein